MNAALQSRMESVSSIASAVISGTILCASHNAIGQGGINTEEIVPSEFDNRTLLLAFDVPLESDLLGLKLGYILGSN